MVAVSATAPAPAVPPAPVQGGGGHRGRVFLVRHGRTEWAHQGRHTGRTDIALDDVGQAQAAALPALLGALGLGAPPALVLSSPLVRAWRTAELAGLDPTVEPDLQEWDYGGYEGLTTAQISAERGGPWTVFRDGVVPGGPDGFPGEGLADLARRCRAVLERARAHLGAGDDHDGGDVVLVGHGHALRVLGAVWLGLEPVAGEHLLLDPASVCVLGTSHGAPALEHWNLTPALVGARS